MAASKTSMPTETTTRMRTLPSVLFTAFLSRAQADVSVETNKQHHGTVTIEDQFAMPWAQSRSVLRDTRRSSTPSPPSKRAWGRPSLMKTLPKVVTDIALCVLA
jgi:hypothetical protein